jgi:hypothetical protein
MTYEEMMAQAKAEYQLALGDAQTLREYGQWAENDSELTALLERVTDIQVKARTKLHEDMRAAIATLGDQCGA